ncbi:MarR family winged helix-turn-helix transcriptional regulator [Fulvimonas yonginensis]|uniref:MarR family transcriptional regulator n=1 Tax=Fulvimonas yonginensis TaxID=1495200 RepID=A0ABU8JBG4_9GAMM
MEMEDVLRALGHLTLGSRLRRIGERLQATTQAYLATVGIDVPAAQLPVLATLDRHGPLTVGELAQALRLTQPGVTRMADRLQRAGLVTSRRLAGDQRVRRLALSAGGRRLIDQARQRVWPVIEAALADQCAGLSGTLLQQLDAFEDALLGGSIEARLATRSAAKRR